MTDSGGPYVVVAALCETVIVGNDGRLSVINLIEQVGNVQVGPDVPDEMPPFVFPVQFVVDLAGGEAKGRFAIKLQPEDPSGHRLDAQEFPVQFGEGTGFRLRGQLHLELENEGRYWIDVILIRGRGSDQAEELLTRLPLNVQYQPQKTLPGAPGTG